MSNIDAAMAKARVAVVQAVVDQIVERVEARGAGTPPAVEAVAVVARFDRLIALASAKGAYRALDEVISYSAIETHENATDAIAEAELELERLIAEVMEPMSKREVT